MLFREPAEAFYFDQRVRVPGVMGLQKIDYDVRALLTKYDEIGVTGRRLATAVCVNVSDAPRFACVVAQPAREAWRLTRRDKHFRFPTGELSHDRLFRRHK